MSSPWDTHASELEYPFDQPGKVAVAAHGSHEDTLSFLS